VYNYKRIKNVRGSTATGGENLPTETKVREKYWASQAFTLEIRRQKII